MGGVAIKNIVKQIDKKYLKHSLASFRNRFLRKELSFLSLDISSSCNLNCRICSLKAWYPNRGAACMSLATLQKLGDVFPRIESVSLQCNCEPLLNRQIISIIHYIKNVNPKVMVSFVTNGTFLSPTLSAELVRSGVNTIAISIDGATHRSFEKVRCGAKFDTVIDNLRNLVAERNCQPNTFLKIKIISVATADNIHELCDILNLGAELGVDGFSVNGLESYTDEMVSLTLYGKMAHPKYEQIFDSLKKQAEELGVTMNLPSLTLVPFTSCDLRGCVIDSDGNVYPCPPLSYKRPYYYEGERCIHPRIAFGNINEKGFYEIWHSPEFSLFRWELRNGKLPPYCTTCLMNHGVLCPR